MRMREILWLLIGLNLFPLPGLLAANDVGPFYAAFKQLRYDQTSASTPILHGDSPYRFTSLITLASGGSLTSATITPPNSGTINTPQSYDPNNDGTGSLEFSPHFATLSSLNSNLADGQYSIHVVGANGTYNSVLTVNGDVYPAEIPQLLNANLSGGALVIDPTKPFTVTWNSFADHGANDVIGFVIDNHDNNQNVTFQLLPPTATSQLIPANTLQPGLTYNLSLTFLKTFDFNTSSIPGSSGYGGYAKQTKVNLSAPQTPNLFATINGDNQDAGGSLFEYTPDGTQTNEEVDGLDRPRGLAFDGAGNLFVANNFLDDGSGNTQSSILKFAPDGTQTVFGAGNVNFFIASLAFDSAGNLFALASNQADPNLASVVYKFTPNGTRSTFGSIPGLGIGLAIDVNGNVYAPNINATNSVIYKFSPDGTRILFANATITPDQSLAGMAFDKFGNLFISVEGDPGNDAILKFTPDGTQSSFASGLTNNPRGLAFDSDGNLFVAELGRATTGDILKFTALGAQSVFASGLGRPEGFGGAVFVAFEPFPVIIGGNVSASATVGQKFVYQISATNHPSFYDATGLPPGLSIDDNSGIIFGIPTNSGDSSVSISASNLFGTGTGILNLSTQPAPAGPQIISSTAATGRTNQPFDFQILVDNASSSAQVTTSQLPAGLNFDPVGREISGTPTADGNFVITLTVTDGNATGTGTLQLTFTSDPTIPVVTSPDSATLIPNQPFKYTATSDAPGTIFSYIGLDGQLHSGPSSAGLPAGLSFDGVDTISGTFTSAVNVRHPLSNTLKIRPPIICSIQLIANNPNGAGTNPLNFFKDLQATDQSDLFVEATGPNGAVVNYTVPTVTNDTGQNIPVTCDVLPGSNFPFGKTPVTCTAIDPNSGASAIVTFNVTVQDTTAPTITRIPTSITVAKVKAAKGQPQGATVNFADQLAATDIISGVVTPTASPSSGSFFPAGKTTVTVTATDQAGNTARQTFTVNVASKAPKAKAPTVTAAVSSVSINEGHSSTFTISVGAGSPSQPLLISYTMSGTAVFGTDYTLSDQWGASLGQSGTVFIPSGGRSGTITLDAPANSLSSGNETATLTVTAGSGYSLAKVKKGKNPDQLTVTINNLP